ncbi:PROTEIN R07E4.1, ISOFORM A [Plasmopara halstedii]|uniref:PROTEIN R07E4.1, ISOFORM A n=1 Tax=Plasmopara halstedii TaxID=4781 RepID=A0A0P1B6N0_PLAHL|nr:PROTEIN R07E4.1, ISOFORM A [Plasmopara halstedii]CEG49428.1 PROTEIN R07E4.1, ISOFORM A [Plasmopara halstedii]|eukprot:XP_024585797.1 PROTEIN R07E4.1, ISOFORM A [Plasmopara halstedii]
MCSADFTGKTLALDAQETYEYQLTTGLETMSVAPITSSDTPPSPYVICSVLTPDDEENPDLRVNVSGGGGSPVTKFLAEWIDILHHCPDLNNQDSVRFYTSALSAPTSQDTMTQKLKNLPNVGNVTVTRDGCTIKNQGTRIVTFLSELGVMPTLTYTSRLYAVGGKVTLHATAGGSNGRSKRSRRLSLNCQQHISQWKNEL